MRDYQTKQNAGALPDSITVNRFGAGEFNSLAQENEVAVSSSGQTLAPADGTAEVLTQLSKALAVYGAGGAGYCLDTGAANAYVLNPVSPKASIPAYFDGMTVYFDPGNENTGAATVNYAAIGVTAITSVGGVALSGGEISGVVTIRYNLANTRFELITSGGTRASTGVIDGFILSNGSDTAHDIDLSKGAANLTNGTSYRDFSAVSPPTKQIDVNWAEGDNAGGFPSGLSLSANTFYRFFVIGKNDGTLDAGFDTSATAANLLADATGYTWYRQVLWIVTDVSSNIIPFMQTGDEVEYESRITDITDSTIVDNTYETGTLSAPPGQLARFLYKATGEHSGTGIRVRRADRYIADVNEEKVKFEGASPVSDFVSSIDQDFSSEFRFFVNLSSQFKYKLVLNNLTNIVATFVTIGWTDDRGRNQ